MPGPEAGQYVLACPACRVSEALREDVVRVVVGDVSAGCGRGNGVDQRAAEVEDAAADGPFVVRAAGRRVACDGAGAREGYRSPRARARYLEVVDAAALTSGVAGDGAVVEGHRPRVGDARVAAGDGQPVQRDGGTGVDGQHRARLVAAVEGGVRRGIVPPWT